MTPVAATRPGLETVPAALTVTSELAARDPAELITPAPVTVGTDPMTSPIAVRVAVELMTPAPKVVTRLSAEITDVPLIDP